jgi:hypothetical protein
MQLMQNSIGGFPQPVIRPQWTHDKGTFWMKSEIFREREKCKGTQERSNYGGTTKLGK